MSIKANMTVNIPKANDHPLFFIKLSSPWLTKYETIIHIPASKIAAAIIYVKTFAVKTGVIKHKIPKIK